MLTIKLSVPKTNEDGTKVKGGTVCVYGLNTRFPVALYPNQWRELARFVPSILAWIDEEEKAGRIVEREASASNTDRTPLKAVDPIVAALMASKGVDAVEALRIAKQSGLLK